MADTPRYRFDFVVPESYFIVEEHAGVGPLATPPARNPILDRLRAALAEDARWERSMMAPWMPFGEQQHLILWIDLTQPEAEEVIQDAVTAIVNEHLPGVRLLEMTTEPF